CFITFGKELKTYQRVALISFVAPGIGNFLFRNNFRYLAYMVVNNIWRTTVKPELKPKLRPERFQLEIPFFHLFIIGKSPPNPAHRRIQYFFNYYRSLIHIVTFLN